MASSSQDTFKSQDKLVIIPNLLQDLPQDSSKTQRRQVKPTKEDSEEVTFTCEFFYYPCSSRQIAQQRQKFLSFLRILVELLKRRDYQMSRRVRAILQSFASTHRAGQQQQQQEEDRVVLSEMCNHVKRCVAPEHWKAALALLQSFLLFQQKKRSANDLNGAKKPAQIAPDGE